jgi:hypothetical protein
MARHRYHLRRRSLRWRPRVVDGIDGGWPPAAGAAGGRDARLGRRVRDDRGDVAGAQVDVTRAGRARRPSGGPWWSVRPRAAHRMVRRLDAQIRERPPQHRNPRCHRRPSARAKIQIVCHGPNTAGTCRDLAPIVIDDASQSPARIGNGRLHRPSAPSNRSATNAHCPSDNNSYRHMQPRG